MGCNETRSILIVDDDADTRSIVEGVVQTAGFTSLQAKDGEQALSIYREVQPDLIVLDVMMPGMDGNAVCAAIKQTEEGKMIPVLMLTARTDVADKVTALAGGADDYLTKPFHYQELQARIKALMRVRELNLRLQQKNKELQAMQQKLIDAERQLVVSQLAGTAAHCLGQPLSAILLNCHLLEVLPPSDQKYQRALAAIKQDAQRMAELIRKLQTADPKKTEQYSGEERILGIEK